MAPATNSSVYSDLSNNEYFDPSRPRAKVCDGMAPSVFRTLRHGGSTSNFMSLKELESLDRSYRKVCRAIVSDDDDDDDRSYVVPGVDHRYHTGKRCKHIKCLPPDSTDRPCFLENSPRVLKEKLDGAEDTIRKQAKQREFLLQRIRRLKCNVSRLI